MTIIWFIILLYLGIGFITSCTIVYYINDNLVAYIKSPKSMQSWYNAVDTYGYTVAKWLLLILFIIAWTFVWLPLIIFIKREA